MHSGFVNSIYWTLPVVTTIIHFTTVQHINQRLYLLSSVFRTALPDRRIFTSYFSCLPMSLSSVSGLLSSSLLTVLTVCRLSPLNCSYLYLHLLKADFRQPSREDLVKPFNLTVSDTTAASVFVTSGTPLLRLSFLW
jgi:hypothetical protein